MSEEEMSKTELYQDSNPPAGRPAAEIGNDAPGRRGGLADLGASLDKLLGSASATPKVEALTPVAPVAAPESPAEIAAPAPVIPEAPAPLLADAPLPDWLTSLGSSPAEPELLGVSAENLDYAIAKIEVMAAAKEAEAAREAEAAKAAADAAAKDRGKDADPLEPALVSFAARVEAARGLVAGAVKEAGLLPEMIKKEIEAAAKRGRELPELLTAEGEKTGIETPELSAEELEILKKAHGILVSHKKGDAGMSIAEFMLRMNVLEQQEQYKLGREMAEAANKKYGAELAAAARELEPEPEPEQKRGLFGSGKNKETKTVRDPALVREMQELNAFFLRTGDWNEVWQRAAKLEDIESNTLFGILNREQREAIMQERDQARAEVRSLESLEGLLGRTDVPVTLREVIAAARAGRQFDFGTGPVANFRRQVYESIMGTLEIEAAPAMATVEAAAPVAAAVPEPEPEPAAPVETAAEKRKKAQEEFLGETKIPESGNLTETQQKMVVSIREKGNKERNPRLAVQTLVTVAEQDPAKKAIVVATAKQTLGLVLQEARAEKDPQKKKRMVGWAKEFGAALGGTSLAAELNMQAFDFLMGMIVAELGGK